MNEPFGGCLPTPLSIITCVALAVTQLRVTGLLGAMVLELTLNETTCGLFTAGGGVAGEAPTPRQPIIISWQLKSSKSNATVVLKKRTHIIDSLFPSEEQVLRFTCL